MIDSMSIEDIFGTRYNFTIGESPVNHKCPVRSFETAVDTRFTSNNRYQAHGVYPGPTYMGAAHITVEGSLFGDTYSDFNDQVIALKYAVLPKPSIVNRDNSKVGTLKFKPTGRNQLQTDVTVESFSMPLDGNTHADWQIIWLSFDPFFIETISADRILY